MADKTTRLLRNIKRAEPKIPIASGMYIPNHSGDHKAGIIRQTPVKDTDLVNKKYIDDEIAGIDLSVFVLKAGDTMTGNLIVQAASSPTIACVDTTNTVSTIQQSGDTAGVFGTQTTHSLLIITDNTLAVTIDASQNATFAAEVDLTSNSKLLFRDTGIFIHSNADGELTIEADSKVIIGVAGTIELGDTTLRVMNPQTNLKIDLGTSSKQFNDLNMGGDLVHCTDGGGVVFGEIYATDNTTETTITSSGVAVQVTIFDTNGENNNTTPDHTNDHITISKAGKYLVNVSATVNSVSGSASRFELSVQSNNGSGIVSGLVCNRNISGGGGVSGVISISGLCDCALNDTMEIWLENETNTQNYIVENISLSLVQIGG